MSWYQATIVLKSKSRGCHLVTSEIERQVSEIRNYKIGMANIFLQHTSASLCLNENADPDVRKDMEMALNKIPAHVKNAIVGASLNIPVTNGKFNLGTWQGIYLMEHRNYASGRRVVVTLQGEKK
ncbi:5938_t:CDS:2 [Entrophospora sp. SA101]|nr:5938_t:CDS:2 [Entrophospora sp. SA101]